jgi:hypothetical protein
MLQNIGSSVETFELNLKVRTSHLIFTTHKILINECSMYIYNACKEAVYIWPSPEDIMDAIVAFVSH